MHSATAPYNTHTMKSLILLIDDDEKLNDLLRNYFAKFGFRTITSTHPEKGLALIEKHKPDIVILDIMLPEMDGFEVCRRIRAAHGNLPVIMLTARGDVTDRVVGLELGADDYLSKPFDPRELVARIQSVLRRSGKAAETEMSRTRKFGPLEINIPRRTASLNGRVLDLTTNEFEALMLLTGSPGEVFDRDMIIERLRGTETEAYNRSVDITMSRLRQKLGDDPKKPSFIKTVWGAGYVFVGGEPDGG